MFTRQTMNRKKQYICSSLEFSTNIYERNGQIGIYNMNRRYLCAAFIHEQKIRRRVSRSIRQALLSSFLLQFKHNSPQLFPAPLLQTKIGILKLIERSSQFRTRDNNKCHDDPVTFYRLYPESV